MHSVEALQAIVDTSSPKCISPAVANAIEAMQPGSGPDAQHWAADLHSTGHSGQKKPPRLTAPDNESTSSLSHQNLPVLRLARGISLPADPEVRRHPHTARLRDPPTCHGSAAASAHLLECVANCLYGCVYVLPSTALHVAGLRGTWCRPQGIG